MTTTSDSKLPQAIDDAKSELIARIAERAPQLAAGFPVHSFSVMVNTLAGVQQAEAELNCSGLLIRDRAPKRAELNAAYETLTTMSRTLNMCSQAAHASGVDQVRALYAAAINQLPAEPRESYVGRRYQHDGSEWEVVRDTGGETVRLASVGVSRPRREVAAVSLDTPRGQYVRVRNLPI